MHRQAFFLGSLGIIAAVALLSCRASVPRALPPDEVLRRTILTNAASDAVAFRMSSAFHSRSFSGAVSGTGVIVRGGRAWNFLGTLHLTKNDTQSYKKLFSRFRIVAPYSGTAFIHVDELSGMLAQDFPNQILDSIGKWGFVGVGTGTIVSDAQESLDPSSVESILSAMTVTENKGIHKAHDGVYEYRLFVQTKTGSGMILAGSLAIDAVRFQLRSVTWFTETKDGEETSYSSTFVFSDFNKPAPPIFADKTTLRFPYDAILDIIFDSSLLPTLSLSSDTKAYDAR